MKTAFVGQDVQLAGEYHDADFDWHKHALATQPILKQQEREGRRALAAATEARLALAATGTATAFAAGSTAVATPASHASDPQAATRSAKPICPSATHPNQLTLTNKEAASSDETLVVARQGGGPSSAPSPPNPHGARQVEGSSSFPSPSSPSSAPSPYEAERWEEFFVQQASVRFFKLRRYLLLEFPMLTQLDPPLHVVELGAGCGSAILPILQTNGHASATVTDVSATSLLQLRSAAATMGIADERIADFVADSADLADSRFEGLQGGCALIMFTLSAVMPDQQVDMLRNAWRSVTPGGLVLIRDHGLYDMVQLRRPSEQWVAPNTYKQGDGTISHFFSLETMEGRAHAAGLETVEVKYACVLNRNKKKNLELRRVFIHAVFRRPLDS